MVVAWRGDCKCRASCENGEEKLEVGGDHGVEGLSTRERTC